MDWTPLHELTERFTLSNGLIGLVKEDHSGEIVSAQVWVKSGSIHETDRLGSGLSHYLEHMVFKGTSLHTGKALSELVQSAGGSINAYTIFDRTVYYIDGPSESLSLFLEVLAELVFQASLSEVDAISEKGVIQREIDMGLDDPDRRLSEAIFSTAYREHPYRYPVIGHRSLFDSLTVNDLRSYYKSRYLPNNMVVVVVGAVNHSSARDTIAEHFGN
ncbi:MAG: peptidase M16, partial [Verrucomicrobia bacterium 21-51-4]